MQTNTRILRSCKWMLTPSIVGIFTAMALGFYSATASSTLKTSHVSTAGDEPQIQTSEGMLKGSYGKVPLSFEANAGQTDRRAKFFARGPGHAVFLTSNGVALSFSSSENTKSDANSGRPESKRAVVSMEFKNANRSPEIAAIDELPGRVNYFMGSNPKKWRTNVRTFAKVRYRNLYRGIDVIYYGNQRQLEYDFVISPGVDPRRIRFTFNGASTAKVDDEGRLILQTTAGEITQSRPFAYQQINNIRREVAVNYRLKNGVVSFAVDNYDTRQNLTIDPVLIYSTPLGGTSVEQGTAIAVDSQGNAFIAGSTSSTDFPLASPFQGAKDAVSDAFVAKLNAAGTALIYSTYLGANGDDVANAIAIDTQGSAYLVGTTGSGGFPTTPGAFQTSKGGLIDGFVSKLSPSGAALDYSTFLGGDNNDIALGVAVDPDGRAYVVGRTESTRLSFLPIQRSGYPILKSVDAGGQWGGSATDLVASSVNVIAQDPSNANTLYAGSNVGVFKSTDAGAHWSLTGTTGGSTPVFTTSIAVDPSNPNVIYAGATSGVYKSVDGGEHYEVKNSGITIPSIVALAIDPTTPTTAYAGTVFGIFKTTNGGDSWSDLRGGLTGSTLRINEVVVDPTNPAIVYIGTNRGMYKTTNSGALWTAINTGVLSDGFAQITGLVIDRTNPSILYAAATFSPSVLVKTTDGGANWVSSETGITINLGGQIVKPVPNALAIDPVTPSNLYVGTTGGGLYKTTDGGGNWSQSNTGLPNTTVNAVIVDHTDSSTVFVGTNVGGDAFFVRFNPTGSAPETILSFGGSDSDDARGVAIDAEGNAYIVGSTSSKDFPLHNAFQSSYGGATDAFVSKLNLAGAFAYSTYLGGFLSDVGRGISVRNNSAYVVGATSSSNFPIQNALKANLAEFDTDAFVTKFDVAGSALEYSTFLGGNSTDQALAVAVDTHGSAYVTGLTSSVDFPVMDAAQPGANGGNDAFLTRLTSAGNTIVHSTYLGGSSNDQANGIGLDNGGNAYLVGTTSSANFPIARGIQTGLKGTTDAFVTKIGIEADLSVTETDSRDPVMVNNPLSYTLTVRNDGPSPATAVTATDTLPSALTYVSASATIGSCSFVAPVVTCSIGNLPAFGSATITINVTPTTAGPISNTATVEASEPDGDTTNNSDTETTTVSASPSINGRVRDAGGNGISALMTLSGAQSGTQQTDNSGFYQFAELPAGGSYTVTPTNTDFSFAPSSQTFDPLNADQVLNFTATPCTYAIAPNTQSFAAPGGTSSVTVSSLSGCPWTATSSSDWITITDGTSGVGNGTVNFTVSPTTEPRAGHLTIAGKNFAVYQESGICSVPGFTIATHTLPYRRTNAQSADVNGDNHPDFLIWGGDGGFTVMINDGVGNFVAADYGFNFSANGVSFGDVNGDGRPDGVASSYNTSYILINFNNGDGSFGPSNTQIPFSTQDFTPLTKGLLTADINNDDKLDVLVLTPGANAIQVLLGNGTGGFTQQPPLAVTYYDVLISIIDVNGDGAVDLIFGGGTDNSRQLAIRLGDGAGNFGSLIISTGPRVTNYARPADFNSDGKVDFVATTVIPAPDSTPADPTFTGALLITLGDGTGRFAPSSTLIFGSGVANLAVADFNRDGKFDVAFTKGGSRVYVALGDGSGSLAAAAEIDTGASDTTGGNFGIIAADFTGDTKSDLAVADYSRGASLLRNGCAAGPSISGRVLDTRTRAGVGGVTVTLAGSGVAVDTDSSGNYFLGELTPGLDYVVTPSKANYRFSPTNLTINDLTTSQVANFEATPIVVQLSAFHYVVDEDQGVLHVGVNRTGDVSGSSTVDYATVNETALGTSDFTTSIGTLRFDAGETGKSFDVLITDDSIVEGWESFRVALSNPTGAILGSTNSPLVEIRDNDSAPVNTNAIDNSRTFVRQHYYDFLNRVPDQGGWDYWTEQLDSCGSDALCMHQRRIGVSAAFFVELEFQRTGYVVYRLHRAAFGTWPNTTTRANLTFANFVADRSLLPEGVNLEQATSDYANAFSQRPPFISAYPANQTNAQFVNKLFDTAGLTPYTTERQQQIDAMTNNGKTRAQVLLDVIDISEFKTREYNRSFVLMQYFGYLRRDPDQGGYDFWLNILDNREPNNYRSMVCGFITSAEYQQRFGSVVTRSNSDCAQ